MKLFVKIVLVLFVAFIAMPTVVCIVDKEVDTAYFYNTTEEEENLSSFNEIKMVQQSVEFFSNIFKEPIQKKTFISFDECVNCKFSSSILLPPPEVI